MRRSLAHSASIVHLCVLWARALVASITGQERFTQMCIEECSCSSAQCFSTLVHFPWNIAGKGALGPPAAPHEVQQYKLGPNPVQSGQTVPSSTYQIKGPLSRKLNNAPFQYTGPSAPPPPGGGSLRKGLKSFAKRYRYWSAVPVQSGSITGPWCQRIKRGNYGSVMPMYTAETSLVHYAGEHGCLR